MQLISFAHWKVQRNPTRCWRVGIAGLIAATMASMGADTISVREVYQDRVECEPYEGKTYCEVTYTSRLRFSGFIEWGGPVDLSSFDETTYIHLGVGYAGWGGWVGEDPTFTPSKRWAYMPIDYVDWDDTHIRIGSLKIRSNEKGFWFLLRENPTEYSGAFADYYIENEPGAFADTDEACVEFGSWEKCVPIKVSGTLSRRIVPSPEYEDDTVPLNRIAVEGGTETPSTETPSTPPGPQRVRWLITRQPGEAAYRGAESRFARKPSWLTRTRSGELTW